MATPYPALRRFLPVANECRRLRIVNHDKVFGELDALAILLVMHQKDIASLLREVVLAALERIVEGLGHLEEIISSGDDVPVCINFQFFQQRNQLVEHFGDTAPHSGGVDHLHRLAFEGAREEL